MGVEFYAVCDEHREAVGVGSIGAGGPRGFGEGTADWHQVVQSAFILRHLDCLPRVRIVDEHAVVFADPDDPAECSKWYVEWTVDNWRRLLAGRSVPPR